ncbi:hypothetical protein ABZ297_45090 [Nonomuraea sp. NPDC005983]
MSTRAEERLPAALVARVCGRGNMLGSEGDAHAELRPERTPERAAERALT